MEECSCESGGPMCDDCQDYWEYVYIHSEGDILEEC